MATVATLDTVLRLNSTAFRQGMTQAAAQANTSLTSISKKAGETASVLLSLKRAANTFGSFYLVKEGIGSLIDAQKQLQAIHYTLIAATGSSTLAADAMKFVTDESQKLGLVLPTAAQGFANLSASATAAGVSMSDQKDVFDAYAKASTTLHLSTEQSGRALLALEQMFAKGKIQAQELRLQLGQAIPGAAQRTQNAVMEMTKGTELAGKSFEQLLAAGDLTTARFFPAIIAGLRGAGRGWEEAANGLNSNLGRVESAWFKLKADVSSGLFNDAATAGAGLLADNLGRIASTVSLIGAGGLARVVGGGLNTGADKATRYQQEYAGARQAAAAEVAHAETLALSAKEAAQTIAVESALHNERRIGAEQELAAREITLTRLQGEQAAAVATLEHQKGAMTLSANLRAQAEAEANLATATAISTREQNMVTGALARHAEAVQLVTTANAKLVVAEEAVAVAQARVAETRAAEAALGGLAATAGRAAKSFGSFAMGLVGGPWGVAAAAIGLLGYTVYQGAKRVEEANAKFTSQVATLRDLKVALDDANRGYKEIGSRTLLSGLTQEWKEASDQVTAADTKIAQIKQTIASLQAQKANPNSYIGIQVDPNFDGRIKALQGQLGQLQEQTIPTKARFDEMSDTLRQQLGPAFEDVQRHAKDLNEQDFKAFFNSLDEGTRQAIRNADQLRIAFADGFGSLQSMSMGYQKQIDDFAKNNAQKAQNEVRRRALAVLQSGGTDAAKKAAVQQLVVEGAQAIRTGAQLDALSAKHTKVAKSSSTLSDAYESLKNTQEGQLATLKGQLAGTDGYSEAQKTLNKMLAGGTGEFRKMTAAQQASAIATQKQILADTQAVDLMNLRIDGARKLADLDREIADEQATRARQNAAAVEGVGHGTQWNAERQAIDEVTAATQKKLEAQRTAYNQQIDLATKANKTAAERKEIDENNLQMLGKITAGGALAAQQVTDQFAAMKAAQADWGAGLQAGIENFQTQQQNNAAQAQKMVEDLTGGFSDAFVQFASGAASAKDAFGSFIDDMYKKALAFVANKAIQALFDSFGNGSAQTAGTTNGGWASLAGNFMSLIRGGGGGGGGGGGFSNSDAIGGSTIGGGGFNFAQISGGRANGGPVSAGQTYQVTENGRPEMLTTNGRNYLLNGAHDGVVTPMREGGHGGGATYVTNINVQPTSTRRTAEQIAVANARTQRVASTRNG